MNFYDTLALYMAIMSIYGTIKLFQSIRDRLIPTQETKPEVTEKPQSAALKRADPVQYTPAKHDRRQKYSVNVEACEQYLASRKN
jgi:hypothetical protein